MRRKIVKPLRHEAVGSLGGIGGGIKIALVGAGGSGSQILPCLVRMDMVLRARGQRFLDVTVYDPDIVTTATAGRQLFYPSEVGLHKSVALVDRANKGFGLEWRASTERYVDQAASSEMGSFGNHQFVQSYDFVITCVDSTAARRAIYDASGGSYATSPKYWLDLGNDVSSGQVVLGEFDAPFSSHDKNPRLMNVVEMYPDLYAAGFVEDDTPSCSLVESVDKQDLFINDHVARWAAHLLWRFLRDGYTDVQGYMVNLETGRAAPLPIKPYKAPAPIKPYKAPADKTRPYREREFSKAV